MQQRSGDRIPLQRKSGGLDVSRFNRAPDEREFAFTDHDFTYICRLIYERTGIHLRPEKREMVYGRLVKRLRALQLSRFSDYLDLVRADVDSQELVELVNAITTNLTRFFREIHHFHHLRDVGLPETLTRLHQQGTNRLRIWSAGCSSGQEPYSIAMVAAAHIPNIRQWDARILATDLDTNMVARGDLGIYADDQAKDIPDEYRRRFAHLRGDEIIMDEQLKRLIAFKPLNLLNPWPMKGPFDIIFCRNVVIYFDKPTQKALFDRYADILAPNGFLYVGHSESLFRVSERFQLIGKTVYRRLG